MEVILKPVSFLTSFGQRLGVVSRQPANDGAMDKMELPQAVIDGFVNSEQYKKLPLTVDGKDLVTLNARRDRLEKELLGVRSESRDVSQRPKSKWQIFEKHWNSVNFRKELNAISTGITIGTIASTAMFLITGGHDVGVPASIASAFVSYMASSREKLTYTMGESYVYEVDAGQSALVGGISSSFATTAILVGLSLLNHYTDIVDMNLASQLLFGTVASVAASAFLNVAINTKRRTSYSVMEQNVRSVQLQKQSNDITQKEQNLLNELSELEDQIHRIKNPEDINALIEKHSEVFIEYLEVKYILPLQVEISGWQDQLDSLDSKLKQVQNLTYPENSPIEHKPKWTMEKIQAVAAIKQRMDELSQEIETLQKQLDKKYEMITQVVLSDEKRKGLEDLNRELTYFEALKEGYLGDLRDVSKGGSDGDELGEVVDVAKNKAAMAAVKIEVR